MVSLHRLMSEACDGELDMREAFLMMGGIRNSIYYFEMNKNKYIGTGGTAEINCPGVFDNMKIDYDSVDVNRFIEQIRESEIELNKYFYIIPVLPEMLERNIEEMNKLATFGQSFFVVDHIEDNRIYFYYPAKSTWIDIEVLKEAAKDDQWVVEAEFEIYRIDKMKLKNNQYIKAMKKRGIENLLVDNLKEFGDYAMLQGDMGTVRIDGSQAYDMVLHHFKNMRNYFQKLEEEKKRPFCNYIFMQLLEFKKFILSGTDAYYRNETNLILHDLYREQSDFEPLFERWDDLEHKWIEHRRVLNKICNYKLITTKTVECLDEIVTFWEKIGSYELKLVSDTLNCIYESKTAQTA